MPISALRRRSSPKQMASASMTESPGNVSERVAQRPEAVTHELDQINADRSGDDLGELVARLDGLKLTVNTLAEIVGLVAAEIDRLGGH